MFTEVIGFIAMSVFIWSTAQKTELRLRLINSLGCLLSIIYGLLSHTYATWIMNTLILMLNIHHIIRLEKESKK